MRQYDSSVFAFRGVKCALAIGANWLTKLTKCWYQLHCTLLAAEGQLQLKKIRSYDYRLNFVSDETEIDLSGYPSLCSDIPCEVIRYFDKLGKAGDRGNISLGTFNFEYLTLDKAKKFLPAYIELIKRHHLLLCVEVEAQGLKYLADACGYLWQVSKGNSRNQAVGMLIHPRLNVTGVIEHASVATIPGTMHMRPALVTYLTDSASGLQFAAAVVHLKSLRGGQTRTSVIRRKQIEALVSCLGSEYQGIVGGDFNCFLDNTQDTARLLEAGFRLVYPGDAAATQSMGGRLDGIFYSPRLSDMVHISRYQVRSFWRNAKIGRAFSDHSLVSVMIRKKKLWY